MKLASNAVFAVKTPSSKRFENFLYVNSFGNISPFWMHEDEGQSELELHGELDRRYPGDPESRNHNHWYDVTDVCDIIMIQSHVTKLSDIDFKLARKFARGAK